jgi:hypothetical protein
MVRSDELRGLARTDYTTNAKLASKVLEGIMPTGGPLE